MTQDLLFDIRDGIGFITLNRPAARNALTFAMCASPKSPPIRPGPGR